MRNFGRLPKEPRSLSKIFCHKRLQNLPRSCLVVTQRRFYNSHAWILFPLPTKLTLALFFLHRAQFRKNYRTPERSSKDSLALNFHKVRETTLASTIRQYFTKKSADDIKSKFDIRSKEVHRENNIPRKYNPRSSIRPGFPRCCPVSENPFFHLPTKKKRRSRLSTSFHGAFTLFFHSNPRTNVCLIIPNRGPLITEKPNRRLDD